MEAAARRAEIESQLSSLRNSATCYIALRGVVHVSGATAASYLQGQLSQEVARMAVGQSLASLLLQPDGTLIATLRVTRREPDRYLLDVEEGIEADVVSRLTRFLLRAKVTLETEVWTYVALRGPDAPTPSELTDAAASVVLSPMAPGAKYGGCDLIGPGALALAPASAVRMSAATYRSLRIEEGVASMTDDLRGRVIPAEANLIEGAVSFTKGCYTGQELIARLDSRGSKVARRLCGIVVDPQWTTELSLRGATILDTDSERVVGTMTSVSWCPSVAAVAGLGFIHRSIAEGDPVGIKSERRETLRATIRSLPLIA